MGAALGVSFAPFVQSSGKVFVSHPHYPAAAQHEIQSALSALPPALHVLCMSSYQPAMSTRRNAGSMELVVQTRRNCCKAHVATVSEDVIQIGGDYEYAGN